MSKKPKKKRELREFCKQARNSLTDEQRKIYDGIITNKVKSSLVYNSARKVALYLSKGSEVNVSKLLEEKNKQFYMPIVKEDRLVFCLYKLGDELKKNKYNILEPTKNELINVKELDLIILPSVACSKAGKRIGMGAGYYDKTLISTSKNKSFNKPILLTTIYSNQLVDDFPSDEWDVNLNYIATEEEFICVTG